MSISDIVARRYAEAFYAVAREQGRVDEVRGQLAAAVAVVTEPVVAEALRNPRLSAQDRRRLLNVFGDIGTETRNLVRLMLERGRLRVLPQVLEHYERMVDRDSGIVRAREGDSIYDCCCGSGGLLIKCRLELRQREKKKIAKPVPNPANAKRKPSIAPTTGPLAPSFHTS